MNVFEQLSKAYDDQAKDHFSSDPRNFTIYVNKATAEALRAATGITNLQKCSIEIMIDKSNSVYDRIPNTIRGSRIS